jgi:hypothetical protein
MLMVGIGSGEFNDDNKIGFNFHNFHQASHVALKVKEG